MLDKIWFGILDLYATKQFTFFCGMELANFVCSDKILIFITIMQLNCDIGFIDF